MIEQLQTTLMADHVANVCKTRRLKLAVYLLLLFETISASWRTRV